MQAQSKSQRRYDIDAIRVLAVLLLIYFHSARAFDFEPWHVRNDELNAWCELRSSPTQQIGEGQIGASHLAVEPDAEVV